MHHQSEHLSENNNNRKWFSEVEQTTYEYECQKFNELLQNAKSIDRISEYFEFLQHSLSINRCYELKFKLELYYIKIIAGYLPPDQISNYVSSFLRFFFEAKKEDLEQDSYRESFYSYFFLEIVNLTKELITKRLYKAAKKVYNEGIEFFYSEGDIFNTILLIQAKGDLYHIDKQNGSAAGCFSLVFKYIHMLYRDKNYKISDRDIDRLKTNLDKISEISDSSSYHFYNVILQLLENKPTVMQSTITFETIAEDALQENNYAVCNNLFYIGSIIKKIFQSNPILIRNEVLRNSLQKDMPLFSTVLQKLEEKTSLLNAIKKDDIKLAKELIKHKIGIKDVNADGHTPLYYAVVNGKCEVVQTLINAGINVNEFYEDKQPPIFKAVETQNFDMVKILVDAGANVNNFEREKSLLYCAFELNRGDIAGYLLQNKAKLKKSEIPKLTSNKTFQEFYGKKSLYDASDLLKALYDTSDLLTELYIHPKSDKAAIYCLPPLTGEPMIYSRFVEAMKTKNFPNTRSIYALSSPVYSSKPTPNPDTIEEMAELYICAIQEKHPKARYILFGYSLGGLIAFEMARQLKKRGKDVIVVGLCDTASPSAMASLTGKQYAENLLASLKVCINAFHISPIMPTLDKLASLSRIEQIEICSKAMIEAIVEKHGKSNHAEYFCNIMNGVKINLLAALKYNPPQDDEYSPLVICFNSDTSIELYKCQDLGWSNHTKECILGWRKQKDTVVNKPKTNHFQIMDEPIVSDLVKNILEYAEKHENSAMKQLQKSQPQLAQMSLEQFRNSYFKLSNSADLSSSKSEIEEPKIQNPNSPIPQGLFFAKTNGKTRTCKPIDKEVFNIHSLESADVFYTPK